MRQTRAVDVVGRRSSADLTVTSVRVTGRPVGELTSAVTDGKSGRDAISVDV